MAGGCGVLGFTLVIPQNHPRLELLPGSGLALTPPKVTQSTLHTHHKSPNPSEPRHGWAWKAPLELIWPSLPAQAGSCGQRSSKYPQGRRHPTGRVILILGKATPSIREKMREESLHLSRHFPYFSLQNRQHFPQEKSNKGIYRIEHSTFFVTSGTVCTGKLSCYRTDFGSRSWQGSRGNSIGKFEENLIQNLPTA